MDSPSAITEMWTPRRITRVIESIKSSTNVIVAETDQGLAYVKAMGNPEGEQALAREWIAARLAKKFGLSTFDHAILRVPKGAGWVFYNGSQVAAGPACASRYEIGAPWGGEAEELRELSNPNDISRLVVFDTLIRNRDRFFEGRKPNWDNAYLSREGQRGKSLTLKAMDFTHCFAEGSLTKRIADIGNIQDNRLYGLFPQFKELLSPEALKKAVDDLALITPTIIIGIVNSVPEEWSLDPETRKALVDFLARRAQWLARNFPLAL